MSERKALHGHLGGIPHPYRPDNNVIKQGQGQSVHRIELIDKSDRQKNIKKIERKNIYIQKTADQENDKIVCIGTQRYF